MKHLGLRKSVIATALAMGAKGLNQGTAGNVSVRLPDDEGFLITPSSMPYEDMTAKHVVAMSVDGVAAAGQRPSSEWRFHKDIYLARPEAGAILHAHSLHATVLACQHKPIPAFHYMIAAAGGSDVRCAPYATFGTQALSDNAVAALVDRKACLLGNHGLITLGKDLKEALSIAVEVETLAAQYIQVLLLGKPKILSAKEMKRVQQQFAAMKYGKPLLD